MGKTLPSLQVDLSCPWPQPLPHPSPKSPWSNETPPGHHRDTSVSKDFDVSETFGGHFGNRLQRDVDRRRAAKVGTRQRLLLKLLTLWLWWLWWLWWLCYRCRMQENWAKLHFEFKPIGLDPRDHGVAQCLISLTARKCQFNCT